MKGFIQRACVFAHYDNNNSVNEYVYYYIQELLTVSTCLVFVTVSEINNNDIARLEKLGVHVIKRKNIGYDFYSYKIGIEHIDLEKYDELILCNDSVFGPLYPLKEVFSKMDNELCDFWGITDSKIGFYHLQSYFFVFRKKVYLFSGFRRFFSEMIILKEKNEIINQYEIGLSKMLINKGYSPAVYVQYDVNTKDNILQLALRVIHKPFKILKLFFKPVYYFSIVMSNKGNASIAFWEKLIRYHRMPFVKKSLFINKKEGKDYKEKLKILEEINTDINYPLSLIERYIEMYRDGK